ncbi:MAG: site-2 protease family protein [Methylococcales bacterium]
MDKLSLVQQSSLALLPLLFAITLHEVAHGWVAKQLGDHTAQLLGRLSLNPLRHIDPVGTLLVPALLLVSGYLSGGPTFIFGWAKPVPVDWTKLGNPKRNMALVAVAGPMANLLMAILWAMVAKMGILLQSPFASEPLLLMGGIGISFNLVLVILNLLPVLPLDGGRIVTSFLPGPLAWRFSKLEPYGIVILIALIATGLLGPILRYPLPALQQLVAGIAGL